MLTNETKGNDEACRSRAYTKTMGIRDTRCVRFSNPIGEGQMKTKHCRDHRSIELDGVYQGTVHGYEGDCLRSTRVAHTKCSSTN
jgi:hypothetical protein